MFVRVRLANNRQYVYFVVVFSVAIVVLVITICSMSYAVVYLKRGEQMARSIKSQSSQKLKGFSRI